MVTLYIRITYITDELAHHTVIAQQVVLEVVVLVVALVDNLDSLQTDNFTLYIT